MDLHAPVVALGPLSVDSWTVLGRIPIGAALLAIALWIVPRAGWRRAALALSGLAAGVAVGVAVLPSVLGALAGTLVALALTLRVLGVPRPEATRVAAVLLAVIAVGRIGCLLNGCCFGVPAHVAWGVSYPPGTLAALFHADIGLVAAGAASAPVHPLPIYEAVGILALLLLLPLLRRALRSDGATALAAAAGYLVLRAGLEPWRAMLNTTWSIVRVGPLSAFQWAAIGLAVACGTAAVVLSWRAGGEKAAAGRARSSSAPRHARADRAVADVALVVTWAVQAAAVNVTLARSTPFVALLAVVTLSTSAALVLGPLLLAPTTPVRRRVALAALPLLLVPAGLRAADGHASTGRRWIYAATTTAAPVARDPESPEPLLPAPDAPSPQPAPAPDGSSLTGPDLDPTRLLRIGDQDTPEETIAARAGELRPAHRHTLSAFGGGGSFTHTRSNSCGGPTSYYDRSSVRAGVSYESVSGLADAAGRYRESGTWQVRSSVKRTDWTNSEQSSSGAAATVLGRGQATRWTAGGMYQWDRPGVSFGLGGLVGLDDSRDTLGPWFTTDQLVLYPAAYVRFGWTDFGLEGGTLALYDTMEQPFGALYLGPPDFRLRVGFTTQYVSVDSAAFSGDLSFQAAPTRWGVHVNAGDGFAATLRFGYDLP